MLIGVDASRAVTARRTGTEFYSQRLIPALLALENTHRFRLYFNTPPRELGFLGRTKVPAPRRVALWIISFPRLWTHIRLGLELMIRSPDVIFVPSHVLPVWTSVPAVATVHDLGYLHFPEAHPARQRWYLDWSTRHNARTARVLIADSGATKADLVTHYGVPPSKIVVAYPGFDDNLRPVTDPAMISAVKRRYGIRNDYFIHIGTLQPRKNLIRLVHAFARMPSDVQLQLVLAGKKGWLYAELFETVRHLGLEERVLFPGYVNDEDKAALLSGAVAYLFPSLYEGFGFPSLEAQACGAPLICSNSSSLPEVAGEGALLVDPTDVNALALAMIRVLRDEELRAKLIARGRKNLERFSWGTCAETVMSVLERVAGFREKTPPP